MVRRHPGISFKKGCFISSSYLFIHLSFTMANFARMIGTYNVVECNDGVRGETGFICRQSICAVTKMCQVLFCWVR